MDKKEIRVVEMDGFQKIGMVIVAIVGTLTEGLATFALAFVNGFFMIMAFLLFGIDGLGRYLIFLPLWLTMQLGMVFIIARVSLRITSGNLRVFWAVFIAGLLVTLYMVPEIWVAK